MGSKERKEREKDRRREDILQAGIAVFVRKGLAAATMDDIARECELAKGTLYLYFTSKEQLYLTIVLRAITILSGMMNDFQGRASAPLEKLEMIGQANTHFYEENHDLFRIMTTIADHGYFTGADLADVQNQLYRANNGIWSLITSIIADGIRRGIFRKDTDPLEIAVGLHAMSMAMTIMIDQSQRSQRFTSERSCVNFGREQLRSMMNRNCGRLIYTILENPPEQEVFLRGSPE